MFNKEALPELEETDPDNWISRFFSYWRFLGGGEIDLYFVPSMKSTVAIIENDEGKITGIQVGEPLHLPKERNLLWHEMGHIQGEQSEDPVEKEFLADMWALEECDKRGFNRVKMEILSRCVDTVLSDSVGKHYKKAAAKILECSQDHFARLCEALPGFPSVL